MPEVYGYDLVIRYLQEAGFVVNNGSSYSPTSWAELNSWAEGTGVNVSPMMRKLLMTLSRSYSNQINSSSSESSIAPFGGEEYALNVTKVYTGAKGRKALKDIGNG